MTYRTKPRTVQADQWFPGREVAGVEVVQRASHLVNDRIVHPDPITVVLTSRPGWVQLNPGDYVVRGGRWPSVVPRAEFEAMYEPARDCPDCGGSGECPGCVGEEARPVRVALLGGGDHA